MLYHLYELTHAAVAPWRAAAHLGRLTLSNPANPWSYTYPAKATSAALEVFEGLTRRYGKPEFGIDQVSIGGQRVGVREEVVLERPFGDLLHFVRDPDALPRSQRDAPRMLVVAPMSGHYATLLRGTVRTLLESFDVYITDWRDARDVPVTSGAFALEDYIDYVIAFMRELGPDLNVMAVCQPGPAVLAATALLAAADDPAQPATVTIMGSPIDTRRSPTEPNHLAKTRPLTWFENNVITYVPFPHTGAMRRVYPGFLQLTGFMTMNLDRHLDAHKNLFQHLVAGDGDSVNAHRKFYDEYLAVMDLAAEYYLDTIQIVFQEHRLAEGTMTHRGIPVDLKAIRNTALMTVEGEKDDISGIGQTQAAHDLCTSIPAARRVDYVQPGVGHYGVFNGSRWRAEIAPRIRDFVQSNRPRRRGE
ncbi:MAG: polyhydroxyalkanoate depolymerase [Gammaproteobacteria bacterium]|nr:polyhydroxyalkanoate depolymerase [Gammaproteobacteria bacterium]MCP5198653.1 polyhydroxyalkanoate depolymerase [Gammaproteobacteria bacterium]